MIPEKRGSEMLDGMDLGGVHHRFIIGTCHADVKRCDDRVVYCVLSGYVDARHKADMVDGKAGNLILML